MMARTAMIGIRSLLASSSYSPDPTDKLLPAQDQGFVPSSNKNMIMTTKSTGTGSTCSSTKYIQSRKKVKAEADISSNALSVTNWIQNPDILEMKENPDRESSLQSLILLQKAMLEKQWTLSFQHATVITKDSNEENCRELGVIHSGVCARIRRMNAKKRFLNQVDSASHTSRRKHLHSFVDLELLQIQPKTYVKGIKCLQLLTHAEVVYLSKKIRTGLSLESHKSRLKKRLGYEPSDKQVAASLSISHAELYLKQIECALARNKLAMCNIGLVMSVAQKYSNMGTEMSDLVQGGLIGLLRGIEKFDSSKGFKISTYVYWWIRQGVSKALVENSKTLRLPRHIHERLSSIRNAKIRLEENGITPSLDRIADSLHMSPKQVQNATEANIKVFSLDREAFPSLSGLPGNSLHNYIADRNLENQPWHAVDEWSLKNEVKDLMDSTLSLREKEIICLYYGLKEERHTWEDIGKMIGLSRERVRQIGLVATEKLKDAARKRRLEAMLLNN